MSDAEWTIGKLLEWTKDYLVERGADATSARLDAEVLLAHARNCQRIELYTAFAEVASDELRQTFRGLVRSRADGTPVAYLVEHREFYSLPFYVNPAVLIPRPETEFLVIRLLDLAKQMGTEKLRIVDVGTGSGVLAICAALYVPECQVVAVDLSPEALAVAKRNAETHGVADRIEFIEGDVLANVSQDDQFDFVISNPPYVTESEYESLDPQVKDHEPQMALVSGADGTDVIRRLIAQSADRLRSNGWLLFEVSPMIAPSVENLLAEDGRFDSIDVTKDLAKHPRIFEARRSS